MRGKRCPYCGHFTLFPWPGATFKCSECGLEFRMFFQYGMIIPVPVLEA